MQLHQILIVCFTLTAINRTAPISFFYYLYLLSQDFSLDFHPYVSLRVYGKIEQKKTLWCVCVYMCLWLCVCVWVCILFIFVFGKSLLSRIIGKLSQKGRQSTVEIFFTLLFFFAGCCVIVCVCKNFSLFFPLVLEKLNFL